jgi:hypothetical protein
MPDMFVFNIGIKNVIPVWIKNIIRLDTRSYKNMLKMENVNFFNGIFWHVIPFVKCLMVRQR